MKLLEYGEEFLFDDMPKVYNPTQKVFFTRLYNLDDIQLPKKVPKIYTSKELAWRLMSYFHSDGQQLLTDSDFIFLSSAKNPHKLQLNDEKRVKLYVFEEPAPTHNLMILIEKDKKISHFYAGACVHIRDILLNDTFATCISMGVEKLYMDLSRATSLCNPSEVNDIIGELDRLLHKIEYYVKIQLLVAVIGCEDIVAELGNQLRGLVYLNEMFLKYHGPFLRVDHFQQNAEEARIFIVHEQNTLEYLNDYQKWGIMHTIKLTPNKPIMDRANHYFEFHYSPLPSVFNLKVLASAVYPDHIFGITHGNMPPPRLPEYLRLLCRIPSKGLISKSRSTTVRDDKPLTQEHVSPIKDTPAPYCIRKSNFEYLDDGSGDGTIVAGTSLD